MRKLLVFVFCANIVLWAVSLHLLPAQVAIHFGKGGMPDSWAAKQVNVLLFLVLEVPLFAFFFFAPALVLRIPGKYVSLPNRQYWLREESRPVLKNMLASKMAEFGSIFFLFLFGVGLLTIQANLADPVRLDERLFLVVVVAFMAYTVIWCVEFIRAFGPPKNAASGP